MITLTGKLETIAGGGAELGSVHLQLHGYGSQMPRVAGTGILARVSVYSVAVDATGSFSVTVPGNDAITPSGTYYTVAALDSDQNVLQINAYQVTGAGTLDLTSAPTYDPTNVIPPYVPAIVPQIVAMSPSATPVFNGSAGLTFELPLTGNVTSSTFPAPVPGNLYVFILIQDVIGGRAFAWPVNVNNGSPPSQLANAITIQAFVARANLTLDAIGVAIYL